LNKFRAASSEFATVTVREAQLEKQLAQSQERLAALERENQLLRQKVDLLVRRIFGSSSEKLSSTQLELLQLSDVPTRSEPPVVLPSPARPATQVRQPRAPRLPDNLPVVEEVIDPEPVRAQPESWRCIGQEVSEQLDYEPGRFLKRRTIRRKYVHRAQLDTAPLIAPLPECLQERGLAAPGLLAHVLVSKYCDHLPLYRLEQIFQRRHGINLPRQTLMRWVDLAAQWLKPIYEQIRTGVLAGGYVQVDETPIDYLEPGHGKTKQGYLWTASRPGGDVFYGWHTSRAAACLDVIIPAGFQGTVQCDGYGAYRSFANGRKEAIVLAGCWAHVRRGFYEAREQSPKVSGWFLRQIQNLYRIESALRDNKAGPAFRAAVRAHQSRPIVERLGRALVGFKTARRFLPKSLLGEAIDYAMGQWSTLEVFLEDGRIEIDNNLVENAIRPTALGKKNWLFMGEADAGQRGAIIYTIVESCRRRGQDPYAYLRGVLTLLPHMTNHQIPEVTPEAWCKAQRQLRPAT
jgi:transposase